MNLAKKVILQSKVLPIISTPKRLAGLWNDYWKPGPYPTTPEERAAAAKKYNLLPEEYEPMDELGDYPDLPPVSGASRDPRYNYDMPSLKKDFGETMHHMEHFIAEDRWDINFAEKQQVPPHKQVLYFVGSMLFFATLCWFCLDKKVSFPHAKKHYTFEGPHYKYPSKE